MAVDESALMFLVLHDSIQNIPTVDDIFGNTVLTIGAPKDKSTQLIKDMALDTVRTKRLGTDAAPCKDKRGHPTGSGLQECLEDSFHNSANCVLPWRFTEADSSNKPLCNTSELIGFENFMKNITEKPTLSHVYEKTKCIHPCEQLVS